MDSERQDFPSLMRFSSADLPRNERGSILREVFGRGICNMELTPLTEAPEVHAELRAMPGLNVMWGHNSPHRMEIDPRLYGASDMFMMSLFENGLHVRHKTDEHDITPGSALIVSTEQTLAAESASACRHVTLRLDYGRLAHLVPNAADFKMRVLPADRSVLQLLRGYLNLLRDTGATLSAQAEHAVVTHIYDLVAVAIGLERDLAETARGSIQAARLHAIRQHVLANLGDHRLSVQQVAAMQGVTTRYVQMLFESEGTTFSEFVLKERLAWTMRRLCDPTSSGQSISTIALDAGFGDLSYFNRVFRRTYGETPSDARARTVRTARH